jgi:hypothetical protein
MQAGQKALDHALGDNLDTAQARHLGGVEEIQTLSQEVSLKEDSYVDV